MSVDYTLIAPKLEEKFGVKFKGLYIITPNSSSCIRECAVYTDPLTSQEYYIDGVGVFTKDMWVKHFAYVEPIDASELTVRDLDANVVVWVCHPFQLDQVLSNFKEQIESIPVKFPLNPCM